MKGTLTTIAALLLTIQATATNYYVDSATGSDTNSGQSRAKPWRSIERVNSQHFKAGDSILLVRGGIWRTALQPQGSGKKGSPIVIAPYGSGQTPLIAGDGFTGKGVISLYNQSHWAICGLELTNYSPTQGDRRGIEVRASNIGLIEGITIKDMIIHDISGITGGTGTAKRTAGIAIYVKDSKKIPTRYDGITISGCTIYNVQNEGIITNNESVELTIYPRDENWDKVMFTNVVIRDNMIFHISKNAMIIRMTEGGVVENNVCFHTSTIVHGGNTIFSRNVHGTIFQYNEGFLNKSREHDGSFYDPDINSPGTIWQYSYSHDNAHGLAWLCTRDKDNKIVVRDNISRGDEGFLLYFNYAFAQAEVLRNAFYVPSDVKPYFMRDNPANAHLLYTIKDNVVVNESDNLRYEYPNQVPLHHKTVAVIENNKFVGKPLVGKYSQGSGDMDKMRRFFCGVVRADKLDTLLNNHIELFRPKGISEKSAVVGYLCSLPLYQSEVEREMRLNRWKFITSDGKIDQKLSRQAAIETLKYIKAEQLEMVKRGMPEAAIFDNFEAYRQAENRIRELNIKQDKVIFFGPTNLDSDRMWHYFYANAQQQLRLLMAPKELKATKEQLLEYFNTSYEGGIEPSWEKRGYDYSEKAVTAWLLRKHYDEHFAAKAKALTLSKTKQ